MLSPFPIGRTQALGSSCVGRFMERVAKSLRGNTEWGFRIEGFASAFSQASISSYHSQEEAGTLWRRGIPLPEDILPQPTLGKTAKGGVFVCSGSHNKIPQSGRLQQQTHFLMISVSLGLISPEASLLGNFLPWPLLWERRLPESVCPHFLFL